MTRRSPWTSVDHDPRTVVRLEWSWDAPSDARHLLVAALEKLGAHEGLVDDAEVVLAELVANAVEHGAADEQGEFELSWCLHPDRLEISVRDAGEAKADALRASAFDQDSYRGRGLAIVDALSDAWSAENDGGGLRVTAELRFVSSQPGSARPADVRVLPGVSL